MFVTYPNAALEENWIHNSLFIALQTILQSIENGIAYPAWPEIIPAEHRDKFRLKRKIRTLLYEFKDLASNSAPASRANFLELLVGQNEIAALLDGTQNLPVLENAAKPIYEKAAGIFEEGFCLLGKTNVRDGHYRIIYGSLLVKTCPFCGYEPLDAPSLPREDEDHYLLRTKYHLAAANLMNLVPMCGRCNSSYKRTKDMIEKNGNRRKALNPYGINSVDLHLLDTNLIGVDFNPEWKIYLLPDTEETRTWEDVFSIRRRITASVLIPMYDGTLDEINDWFKECDVYFGCNDNDILEALERLADYKKRNREQGLGFLKDKVVETLIYHYRRNEVAVIALVRDALSPPLLVE